MENLLDLVESTDPYSGDMSADFVDYLEADPYWEDERTNTRTRMTFDEWMEIQKDSVRFANGVHNINNK